MILSIFIIFTLFSVNAFAANTTVPPWIKNNAGWWAEGTIDDDMFIQGIQFLVKEGIIEIPPTTQGSVSDSGEIPSWIKNNAGWWAEGTIDDDMFIQGIQFLVKEGIIDITSPPYEDTFAKTIEDTFAKTIEELISNEISKIPSPAERDTFAKTIEELISNEKTTIKSLGLHHGQCIEKHEIPTETTLTQPSTEMTIDNYTEIVDMKVPKTLCPSGMGSIPFMIEIHKTVLTTSKWIENPVGSNCYEWSISQETKLKENITMNITGLACKP